MAIPHKTAKVKSTNTFCCDDLRPNCQIYFPPIFPVVQYIIFIIYYENSSLCTLIALISKIVYVPVKHKMT